MKNKETLEEAAKRLYPNRESFLDRFQDIERKAFINGAKSDAAKAYWYNIFKQNL